MLIPVLVAATLQACVPLQQSGNTPEPQQGTAAEEEPVPGKKSGKSRDGVKTDIIEVKKTVIQNESDSSGYTTKPTRSTQSPDDSGEIWDTADKAEILTFTIQYQDSDEKPGNTEVKLDPETMSLSVTAKDSFGTRFHVNALDNETLKILSEGVRVMRDRISATGDNEDKRLLSRIMEYVSRGDEPLAKKGEEDYDCYREYDTDNDGIATCKETALETLERLLNKTNGKRGGTQLLAEGISGYIRTRDGYAPLPKGATDTVSQCVRNMTKAVVDQAVALNLGLFCAAKNNMDQIIEVKYENPGILFPEVPYMNTAHVEKIVICMTDLVQCMQVQCQEGAFYYQDDYRSIFRDYLKKQTGD